jgi:peptidoglycan hydrolase-like protein with peptidoglycan-binding domain
MLRTVGTAVGALIGWTETPPPADPASVRTLLTEVGVPPGESLEDAVRTFQEGAGLEPDGVAGPRTVHLLARCAQSTPFRLGGAPPVPCPAAPGFRILPSRTAEVSTEGT